MALLDGAFEKKSPGFSDFWHLLARLELSGWSMVKVCFAVSNDALREVAGQAVELTAIEAKGCWATHEALGTSYPRPGSQRCSLPF